MDDKLVNYQTTSSDEAETGSQASSGGDLYSYVGTSVSYSYQGDSIYSETEEEAEDDHPKAKPLASSSSSSASKASNLQKDWNGEFRAFLAMEDCAEKYKGLSALSREFCYAAKLYAKVIISEHALPSSSKSIQPSGGIKGIAGGAKYLINGILFKLALDNRGLYEGDANAMKAANHELRGCTSYYNCAIPRLNVPLMAVIDYRGHRIVAVAVLPIADDTLCYGSSDGGQTCHNSDATLDALMKQAAGILNLKGHIGGQQKKSTVYGPADIEGHHSHVDGNYYLLDFARTFPPQQRITKTGPRTHLFQLLRPELVKSNPVPLSSDALTAMGKADPLQSQHNAEVEDACKRLFSKVIPAFAVKLDHTYAQQSADAVRLAAGASGSAPALSPLRDGSGGDKAANSLNSGSGGSNTGLLGSSGSSPAPPARIRGQRSQRPKEETLIEDLHAAGINVRHLGLLRVKLSEDTARNIVLNEMVARLLKDMLRQQWRETMKVVKLPSEEPYRRTALEFLNSIFVSNRDAFWKHDIKKPLAEKFPLGLHSNEAKKGFHLLDEGVLSTQAMLSRFQKLTGLRLRSDALDVLIYGTSLLVESDLEKMAVVLKEMNVVSEATAILLSREAEARNGSEAKRLYQLAHDRFVQACGSTANNKRGFYEWGRMLSAMALRFPDDSIDMLYVARTKLQLAIVADPNYHQAHLSLGDLLLRLVSNKSNLWLAHRSDSDKRFKFLLGLIKDAGLALNNALETGADRASLAALLETGPKQLIGQLSQPYNIHHLYLYAFAEASLPYPRLRKLVKERAQTLTTLEIVDCTFGSPKALKLLVKAAGPHLYNLTIQHAPFLDTPTLKRLLGYCGTSKLRILDLTGAVNLSQLPPVASFPPTLETVVLAICPSLPAEALAELGARHSIRNVNLSGNATLADQIGEVLSKNYPQLEAISLAKVADLTRNACLCNGLKQPLLTSASTLMVLDLTSARNLTNAALIAFSKASPVVLHTLRLFGCLLLTDEGVVPVLKKTPKLRYLNVNETKITDATMKQCASSCLELESFSSEICDAIRGKEIKKLLDKCPHLTNLNISYCKEITDEAFQFVSALKHTEIFDLSALIAVSLENLTDAPMVGFLAHCPRLRTLNIANCVRLTNSVLFALAQNCPMLDNLYLSRLGLITDDGMATMFSRCKELLTLAIESCSSLRDKSFAALGENCQRLQVLNCAFTKVSPQGLQYMMHKLSKLEVLNLSHCNLLTADFIVGTLRHRCKNLYIDVEDSKKKPNFHLS